jgi:hypothetical protein
MAPATYKLLICPVCLEQVEWDREEGSACFHAEYGHVEAIEVSADPDQAQLTIRKGLALFRLQEDRREAAFRQADRDWYANLSVADRFWHDQRVDRDRREAQARRLASLAPGVRRMEETMRQVWSSSLLDAQLSLGRNIFAPFKPRELDDWFAEEGMPDVTEALGL